MKNPDFPLVHSNYGNDNSFNFIFIGGSTMAGKGLSSAAYPELFSEATGLSVSVYTKYLIKLRDVISVIQSADITNVCLFINCGAGDQMRVLNPVFSKAFPAHWSLPAHMEPPVSFSRHAKKRFYQQGVLVIKYFIKYLAKIFGFYPNTTKLETFIEELHELALIAHQRSLKVCWIDTPVGDFRIPLFVRREKERYCRLLFQETLKDFPTGSLFLSLDGQIEPNDLLDDSFHLNVLGHIKMVKMLTGCIYSEFDK